MLKRSPQSPDEEPCCLSLTCGPGRGEGILSVGILSSARNMEVYSGEEYCGTSRGRSVGTVLDHRLVPSPCDLPFEALFSVSPALATFTGCLTLVPDVRGEIPTCRRHRSLDLQGSGDLQDPPGRPRWF